MSEETVAVQESEFRLSAEQKELLRRIRIVLVEPEEPANIGGVARAMKNTGLSQLVVISREPVIPRAAYWVAHAAEEILDNAAIYTDLESAISEMHLVVGTTQRVRSPYFPMQSPEEVAREALITSGSGQQVALVFGRESKGLFNHELYLCNRWARIPSPVKKPAYNLAQAALIFAYSIFRQLLSVQSEVEIELASRSEYEAFYRKLEQLLRMIDFHAKDSTERFVARVRRVLNSVPMERRDLHVLFTLLGSIQQKLADAEKKAAGD